MNILELERISKINWMALKADWIQQISEGEERLSEIKNPEQSQKKKILSHLWDSIKWSEQNDKENTTYKICRLYLK